MHADLDLAARLERIAADASRDAAAVHRKLIPGSQAEAIPCGSGVAAFLDETSPLSQVKGAGLTAATRENDIDAVEAFYGERGTPVTFILSPFADAALFTYLSRRGYEMGEFVNALVRGLSSEESWDEPDVQVSDDAEEWASVLAGAFFEMVTPAGVELGRTLFAVPSATNLSIRAGAEAAAGAQIDIRGGVATFQCDGTLRRYRKAGLQTMLIRARLAIAARSGCDLATADALPGTVSQRNYEKLGFRVAYTRVTMIKPCV